jgi:hypothetical protein
MEVYKKISFLMFDEDLGEEAELLVTKSTTPKTILHNPPEQERYLPETRHGTFHHEADTVVGTNTILLVRDRTVMSFRSRHRQEVIGPILWLKLNTPPYPIQYNQQHFV